MCGFFVVIPKSGQISMWKSSLEWIYWKKIWHVQCLFTWSIISTLVNHHDVFPLQCTECVQAGSGFLQRYSPCWVQSCHWCLCAHVSNWCHRLHHHHLWFLGIWGEWWMEVLLLYTNYQQKQLKKNGCFPLCIHISLLYLYHITI